MTGTAIEELPTVLSMRGVSVAPTTEWSAPSKISLSGGEAPDGSPELAVGVVREVTAKNLRSVAARHRDLTL